MFKPGFASFGIGGSVQKNAFFVFPLLETRSIIWHLHLPFLYLRQGTLFCLFLYHSAYSIGYFQVLLAMKPELDDLVTYSKQKNNSITHSVVCRHSYENEFMFVLQPH